MQEHIIPNLEDDSYYFSGSSGGALVSFVLANSIPVDWIVNKLLTEAYDQVNSNIFKLLDVAFEFIDKIVQDEHLANANTKLRILTTKVVMEPPFCFGQVFSTFEDVHDLREVLKCSCKVPLIQGLLPYKTKHG